MLRVGVLSQEQARGIVAHLNDEEFLSPWGLFGIRVDSEKIVINPVDHPCIAGMGLENFRIRKLVFNISIDPDGKGYNVTTGNRRTHPPVGRAYQLLLTPESRQGALQQTWLPVFRRDLVEPPQTLQFFLHIADPCFLRGIIVDTRHFVGVLAEIV